MMKRERMGVQAIISMVVGAIVMAVWQLVT